MRTQVVATLVAGLALLGTSLVPGLQAQLPSRERTLFVSAVDTDGKPVPGLGPEAFDVREDGVRREVLRVSRATEPIDIALLVDNSTAASEEIVFLRNGLSSFVKKMSAGNHIAVITLADRPTIRLDYSNDMAALSKSVGSIFAQPMSGMTLLDAVIETSKGFGRRETTPRAIMVAVFTDGREFTNAYSKDAIKALTRAKVAMHAVTNRTVPPHRGTLDAGKVAVPRRRAEPVGGPAHDDAESDGPRACARTAGQRAAVAIQGGVRPARIADSAGQGQRVRGTAQSGRPRRAGSWGERSVAA